MEWQIWHAYTNGSLAELQNVINEGGGANLLEGLRAPLSASVLVLRDDALPRLRLIEQLAQNRSAPILSWLGDVLSASIRVGRADVVRYLTQRPVFISYVRPMDQATGLLHTGTSWLLFEHRDDPNLSQRVAHHLHRVDQVLTAELEAALPANLIRYIRRAI